MIAAIILAAGESKRLGHPKQLVELDGAPLLERAVRTAQEAGCDPIVVILGAHNQEIIAHTDLHQATSIINHAWREGIASSIRLGLEAIPDSAEGALLLTCDQPAVSAPHLQRLMATPNPTASAYAGRHGVPAYFPASAFSALTQLRGDTGARDLLRNARTIDLPNGELDIDTATDLANAKLLYG